MAFLISKTKQTLQSPFPSLLLLFQFYTSLSLLNSALSSQFSTTLKNHCRKIETSPIIGERCVVGAECACSARAWFWWWSRSGWCSGSECSSMGFTSWKTPLISAIHAAVPAEEGHSWVMLRRHCISSSWYSVLGISLFL